MTRPLRVLIVDDDFRVGGMHRDLVDAHGGFTTMPPARTAAEAQAAIRDERPDLLLVDVYLPDGDGIEVLRASGADGLVLSAATDAATVRRALRAGALGYLMKPFEPRALTDRLDRFVRFRNLLGAERPITQDEIDRASAILHGSGETASATRSATEQLIVSALGREEASAAEIAERVGVSRATAQRHLSTLATRGVIEVTLRYGTTGRPEHRFRTR